MSLFNEVKGYVWDGFVRRLYAILYAILSMYAMYAILAYFFINLKILLIYL